jgi:hypothetical protein
LQKIQNADRYESLARQQHGRIQQYESVGGMQAMEQLQANNGAVMAAIARLAQALDSPEQLIALANDPARRDMLRERILIDIDRAKDAGAKKFQETLTSGSRAQQESGQRDAALRTSIGQYLTHHGLPPTEAEVAYKQFAPFASVLFRKANAQDVQRAAQFGVRVEPGQTIIDNERMAHHFASRAELYKQQQAAATAASQADTANAARLAATQPVPVIPPRVPSKRNANNRNQPRPPKLAPTTFEEMTSAQQMRALKNGTAFSMIGNSDG